MCFFEYNTQPFPDSKQNGIVVKVYIAVGIPGESILHCRCAISALRVLCSKTSNHIDACNLFTFFHHLPLQITQLECYRNHGFSNL